MDPAVDPKDPDGHKPKVKPDWGLHYTDLTYILRVWDVWVRSGYVVFPNGKGYDEQDPLLVEDFHTLNADLDYQLWMLNG